MTRRRYRLIALHGFLGAATDWDLLRDALPEAEWAALDLWPLFSGSRVVDWPAIGSALEAELRAAAVGSSLPVILVGYSFGARLALAVPGLGTGALPLAGACLVSCNPGLPDQDDGARAARRAADEAWARKIIDAPPQQIWKEWDAQQVFAGSVVPRREPRLPAPRVTIARAMRVATLAGQPDRQALLRAWRQRLLWVTGARDAKFGKIAASLAADGVPATFATVEHAGHRVPWDNPAGFAEALTGWIDGILPNPKP